MCHASQEVQVRPLLLNDVHSFTHHAGIICANLDNILGPNLNQVPLDHICDINGILHMTRGINSPKNSSPAGETHIIFKRGWLLTELQPSPASVALYVLMNIFVLSVV
jgi:hypothetical protein